MDRLKFIQIVIYIAAVLVIARLFYWQFIAKIPNSGQSLKNDEIPAERGEIFAYDNFPLVANDEAFLIYGQPNEVTAKEEIAKIIAPYLISEKFATQEANLSDGQIKLKEEEIKKQETEVITRLNNKSLVWVQIAKKAPKEVKQKLEAAEIKGVGFEPDSKRYYPEASMAAHVLGFVGQDKFGADTGYFGLEGYYERILKGQPGKLGRKLDPFGLPILVDRYLDLSPKKGSSLHLTIDRTIQFIIEATLKKSVEKYGAKEGTVIVSDPKTGHILAMATYPNYNPQARLGYEEKLYKNPAVGDTYEPGSTFKLFAAAAALDLSLVRPATRCPICSGPREIGGFEISTWNKKYYKDSTLVEILQHSDNVGITYIADQLGIDNLFAYIKKFGFGELTGIDLQEEATGNIREKDQWRPIDLATASFGQGLAVTGIQMVQAVSAFANGGKLITPKVTDAIQSENKQQKVEPDQVRQIISPKTAAQITEMMVNAVREGEARVFAPKDYAIAGKTGTAQIPVAGHYDPEKTIASFIGFAPAQDPKFVMLVRFTEPSSSPFGSETAAPTFFEIATELFNYWGIPSEK